MYTPFPAAAARPPIPMQPSHSPIPPNRPVRSRESRRPRKPDWKRFASARAPPLCEARETALHLPSLPPEKQRPSSQPGERSNSPLRLLKHFTLAICGYASRCDPFHILRGNRPPAMLKPLRPSHEHLLDAFRIASANRRRRIAHAADESKRKHHSRNLSCVYMPACPSGRFKANAHRFRRIARKEAFLSRRRRTAAFRLHGPANNGDRSDRIRLATRPAAISPKTADHCRLRLVAACNNQAVNQLSEASLHRRHMLQFVDPYLFLDKSGRRPAARSRRKES